MNHWKPVPSSVATSERPLRTMFLLTSMPVGGAEVLLANLVRRLNRQSIEPEIACLKELGPLGEVLAKEIPVFSHLIRHKYDVAVVGRLTRLFRQRRIDCAVTVGAGDKMFWGRLAARRARLPVVLSALHSTGWPDGVGRLNRLLTPLTDGFIAVASAHARYLREVEHFPHDKVFMIPNGVDTQRFVYDPAARQRVREELGIPLDAPVVGIVAALRPEKDHELFMRAAHSLLLRLPQVQFLIVGDGPLRSTLEQLAQQLGLGSQIHFLGARSDVPELLSALDLFALTSQNEASPVSILEAMACGRPVIAPRVGSIAETVIPGENGELFDQRTSAVISELWHQVLISPERRDAMGQAARASVIRAGSLDTMVHGYEQLIRQIARRKGRGSPTD